MLNSACIMGRIISAPQYANGSYNSTNQTDMVFTISSQRDPKPNGQQSQIYDTVPCICRDYMAQKTIQLQLNQFVTVSGRVETGTDIGKAYMVLNVRKINVL